MIAVMHTAVVDRNSLPDAVEPLRDMVVELSAALTQLQAQAEQQRERFIAHLAELRRRLFGPRSETLPHEGQAALWTETVQVPVPPPQDTHEEVGAHKRRRRGRPAIDADLPVRRVEHDLSEQDKAGFERCVRIGQQTSRMLEYTPARLEIVETVRATYRCEDADGSVTVRTAQAAASPIAKCNAGAGLLAQVMVAKYADHTPLARQERIFARHGLRLSRQTLCDWVLACAHKLKPLAQALAEYVRSAPVIFSDDTTLALQQPRVKGQPRRGRTVTARLWTYLAGGWRQDPEGRWQRIAPAALYDFTLTRSGEHPRRVLQGWRGTLQADDFSGYHQGFREGITHAACWAHARRKFFEIVKAAPQGAPPGLAHEAMRFIGAIYKIEADIRGKPPDERATQRKARSAPLLQDFHQWLQGHARGLLPKSPLGQAFAYTLSNWGALNTFVGDGAVEVDNNVAERAMRLVALSRKNWLFAGSERGGQAAAVAFSLIETARLNGVEPWAYLKDVLERIDDHRVDRLHELLPMHWKATAA
jgi:transposase